jgi:hypothetical protein
VRLLVLPWELDHARQANVHVMYEVKDEVMSPVVPQWGSHRRKDTENFTLFHGKQAW